MQRDIIGAAHRWSISATLIHVDKGICAIEQWARGRELRSCLYQEHNDLSALQRHELLAESAAIRKTLSEIRDLLELPARLVDAGATIRAQAIGLWESVVDLKGKHLRAYGELPSGLAECLEPRVAELLDHLNRIVRAAAAC